MSRYDRPAKVPVTPIPTPRVVRPGPAIAIERAFRQILDHRSRPIFAYVPDRVTA